MSSPSGLPPSTSIAIIGGGIGGLVLALQLHATGFTNIYIFESSQALKPIGSGINLQPSAVLILRNLGLLRALEDVGIKTKELRYFNKFGQAIIGEERGEGAGYSVPQFSVHRGVLHGVLLETVRERVGSERVTLGCGFVGFEQDQASITARFERRSTISDGEVKKEKSSWTGDVLIAADGINSTVRSLLYPNEGPPNFSGRLLWRGVTVRKPYLTGRSMVWAGHADQKFIAYPIGKKEMDKGESMVNWIAELRVRDKDDLDKTPPKADWGKSVAKDRFMDKFEGWELGGLKVSELITETETVFEFPMCDRDPVDRWSFERLTMLGDAAHPLYPIGSNGATQAVLDAVALSDSLKAHSSVPEALKAYQDLRLPPTAKICYANRGNGPDHVLQLVHERAPDGFENINDVILKEELEEVGRAYKRLAGFDIETVNAKAKATESLPLRFE